MNEKILINTGPSPRGFHRLEAFFTCPMKYRWNMKLAEAGHVRDPSFALVRGSIGHAGLAHHYARKVAVLKGKDPDRFYSPLDAMIRVADLLGDSGHVALKEAHRAFEFYVAAFAAETWEVIGIERLLETEFEGFRYTARADLVVKIGSKVYMVDHKFVGRIEDKTFQRYSLSGQFLGQHHLGLREFGSDFGGVLINAVGCKTLAVERRAPEPAPFALGRYPAQVARVERQIAMLAELPDENWNMAVSEYACFTPYGKCDHFDRCRWGTAVS